MFLLLKTTKITINTQRNKQTMKLIKTTKNIKIAKNITKRIMTRKIIKTTKLARKSVKTFD